MGGGHVTGKEKDRPMTRSMKESESHFKILSEEQRQRGGGKGR